MALPWYQFRRRREHPPEINLFGGIANVNPPVGVFPQEAPDAIKQGSDTPARIARMPRQILTGIDPWVVEEGRFVALIIAPHPRASYPMSRMTPDRHRANIRVPPHVAYGSLFTYQSPAR